MTGVLLKNVKTGERLTIPCQGVFIAIGHAPNTEIFQGQLELDQNGYLIIRPPTTSTNVPGVFAAGDVADSRYRQATTAVGTGCMAAIDAYHYIQENEAHKLLNGEKK